MARLQFICEKCGKVITAYKEVTSGRRKCSSCGSYSLRRIVPTSAKTTPHPGPTTQFIPRSEELPDSELPPVSIVIPTYNGKHHLKKCLPALQAIDYPQDKIEVIVVDNASSDGTEALLKKRFPWVKFIRQEINHYCRANNLGIKAATGQYVLLLNNDTEVEKAWLKELVKVVHPNPQIGAVGSKVLLLSGRIHTTGHYEQPNFHWGDRGFEEEDKGQYDQIEEVPSLCGVSVLYRKECIDDVGLLDERFVAYYEDVDYSLRLRKKGWRLFYVPKSVVHHFYNGTASTLSQEGISFTRYYTERNRLLLLAKHQPDQLPDALSTFSHFYVDKDYRILYQALPVVLPALFENADAEKLPELLTCLFENLRKIAVYETEGLRTERQMYQQRLKELEDKWQKNLVNELTAKEKELKSEFQRTLREELERHNRELEHQRDDYETRLSRVEKEHKMFLEQKDRERERLREEFEKWKLGREDESRQREHAYEEGLEKLKHTHEEEVRQLRKKLSWRENELSQRSTELAVARESLQAKLSDKLKLNVYREDTKEKMIRELHAHLQGREHDLKIAIEKIDSEIDRFENLQKEHKNKTVQFLDGEQRTTDQYAEILELRKRLAAHEGEIGQLVKELEMVREHQSVMVSQQDHSMKEQATWLPCVSKKEAKKTLAFQPLSKPEEVHWSITHRCFFKCKHCDIWKHEDADEITSEQAKVLLDRLHSWLGPFTLNISGGEPLLRTDLLEIIAHADSLGIATILTTNGYRVSKRMADKLSLVGLKSINVSIDGFEGVHNRIRGMADSYHRAFSALKWLNAQKKGMHVTATTVVTALNLEQMPELVNWTADLGLDGITFQALCNNFSSKFSWDWWQRTDLWPKDPTRVTAVLDSLVKMKMEGAIINNSVAHLQRLKHYFLHSGRYPGECRVGLKTLHINERGDFLLCWNMAPLGNVLREKPAELWKSAEALLRRHQIQNCSRECFILNCNSF